MTSFLGTQAKLFHTVADRLVPHAEPLAAPISAEHKTMTTHRGQSLAYYASRAAKGRPLVLLHSVNACASSYEVRPLFDVFRGTRPVYALDLPGFGLSAREERPYTVDLFVDSIRELLARVSEHGEAADVVALSLTSEFASRVALEHKELVHSLTLVSPTGFGDEPQRSPVLQRLMGLACRPPMGDLLYGAVVSQPSVGYFLRKAFGGRLDTGLLRYAYETSHQPGAKEAPLAFLRGDLFTPDVREAIYDKLATPALVVFGDGGYTSFEKLSPFLARHPTWKAHWVEKTRGLPQFEKLGELVTTLEDFWHGVGHGHAHTHTHTH